MILVSSLTKLIPQLLPEVLPQCEILIISPNCYSLQKVVLVPFWIA